MKFLVKLLVIGILGFVVLAVGGYLALPSVARTGVEQGAGSALGIKASLADVVAGFGLGNTEVGIQGLVLESPEGFGGAPLLEIGEASATVGTFSLLSDTVRIPGITLTGLKFHLIQDGLNSNLKPVLDRISEQASSSEADTSESADTSTEEAHESPKEEEDAGSSKVLAFGDISLSEIGFSLELKGVPGMEAKRFEWTAPPFEFNLSDKAERANVRSVGDLAERIIEELEARGMAAAEGVLPPKVLALLNSDSGLGGAADQLLDQGKDKLKELEGELKDDLKGDLKGAVNDLFGGK
ncbi:MAG: hypothetical protein ACI8QC_002400 [Planctomycetota bacterium]|jgi:hypothetical protein